MPHCDDHEASANAALWATVWSVVLLGFAVAGAWQSFSPSAGKVIAVLGEMP